MSHKRDLFCVLLIQLGFVLALLATLDSTQKAESFGGGAAFATFNLILLWWIWSLVLIKKSVARLLPVVVFKYSILIILLAFLGDKIGNKLYFTVGIFSIPLAITIYALGKSLRSLAKK